MSRILNNYKFSNKKATQFFKWGRFEQILHQEKNKIYKWQNKAYEKMCSISVVDKESIRRANKEIHIKRLTTLSVGEDVEKRKLSYSAAGDVK